MYKKSIFVISIFLYLNNFCIFDFIKQEIKGIQKASLMPEGEETEEGKNTKLFFSKYIIYTDK
jgi:hypothetical protein